MLRHRKILFEIFMPEARFPDEKFWTKSGDAIQTPKGPPPGARGRTHADYGAKDSDEPDIGGPEGEMTASTKDLFNHFSKTLHEFERNVYGASEKMFGKDFAKVIDGAWGKPGMVRDAIRKMWDNHFTDHEAFGEIGFLFDVAQNGSSGYGGYGGGSYGPSHYPISNHSWTIPKEDWDDSLGDVVPRKSRPKGVKPGGGLAF